MVESLDLNRYGATTLSSPRTIGFRSILLEQQYKYYRLYTADGPIEAVTSVYNNKDYLGRISAKSITPPHTVASSSYTMCAKS